MPLLIGFKLPTLEKPISTTRETIIYWWLKHKLKIVPNPPESPFEWQISIPLHDKNQRGTCPEQSWLTGWKKGNFEARPPLIAKHELKDLI